MRIGLVHAVTDDLEDAVSQAVVHALNCAPQAVAVSKKLLWDARFLHSDKLVEHAASLFVDAVTGSEGAEGTRAFVEKRKADWMPKGVTDLHTDKTDRANAALFTGRCQAHDIDCRPLLTGAIHNSMGFLGRCHRPGVFD